MEIKINSYSIRRKTKVVRQEEIINPNKAMLKISNDAIRSPGMIRKKMLK